MYFQAIQSLSSTPFKIVGEEKYANIYLLLYNEYTRLPYCTIAEQATMPSDAAILVEAAILQTAADSIRYKEDRARRYPVDSDPLFFEFQYMEEKSDPGAAAKKTEWLAAVDKIKQDYPA